MRSKRRTLLWRIHSQSGKHSYLFGTMHVRDVMAFEYFDQVKPFILDAEVYAAEMDLGQADRSGQIEDALLPGGQTLRDLMSEKKFRKVKQMVKKAFGIEIRFFERIFPLFIVNQIAEAQLSNDYPQALDQAMWSFAKEYGKVMVGVESYAEQVRILHQLPLDIQVKQLIEIARKPARIRKTTRKLIRYYRSMDLQQMYRYSKKGMGGMRKTLIYARNRRMAAKIAGMVENGSCFIAVGAGHLAGEKGLLHLLRSRGLVIQPVPLERSGSDSL